MTTPTNKLIFLKGRLVKSPTQNPDGNTFPYGGTELGLVSAYRVIPNFGEFPIFGYEKGTLTETLYKGESYVIQVVFRTMDADAIATIFPNTTTDSYNNVQIRHNPATVKSGTKGTSRAVSLLFVPDNELYHQAFFARLAVGSPRATAVMVNSMNIEHAYPANFKVLPPSSGDFIQWGMLRGISVV